MCGKDPTALELTDEPIHKQCIHNPVWLRLKNDTGVAGRCIPISMYHNLQNVNSFLTGSFKVSLKVTFISKINPRNLASFTVLTGAFPRIFDSGENPLSLK